LSRQIQAFRKNLGLQKNEKIETLIFSDAEFKKILDKLKDFIKDRTGSAKFEISSENVTTYKERFINKVDFKIKDKRGQIIIKK